MRVYTDGVLFHTATILDDLPHRFPGGKTWRETEIELTGVATLEELVLAETIAGLADP
jgi:hypothetical protein